MNDSVEWKLYQSLIPNSGEFVYPYMQIANAAATFSDNQYCTVRVLPDGWFLSFCDDALSIYALQEQRLDDAWFLKHLEYISLVMDYIELKDWYSVTIAEGSELFKKLLWLEAGRRMIAVHGYHPTSADLQLKEQLCAQDTQNSTLQTSKPTSKVDSSEEYAAAAQRFWNNELVRNSAHLPAYTELLVEIDKACNQNEAMSAEEAYIQVASVIIRKGILQIMLDAHYLVDKVQQLIYGEISYELEVVEPIKHELEGIIQQMGAEIRNIQTFILPQRAKMAEHGIELLRGTAEDLKSLVEVIMSPFIDCGHEDSPVVAS